MAQGAEEPDLVLPPEEDPGRGRENGSDQRQRRGSGRGVGTTTAGEAVESEPLN